MDEHSTHCQTAHEEIMGELKRINKRMDDDWKEIDASRIDRIRREGIWNVIKWVGFGGMTALILKLLD